MGKDVRARGRWGSRFAAALLAAALLAGPGSAEGQEPVWPEYPASNFEPGPGWPEGWTPPPTPTGISDRMQREIERVLKEYPELYDRWEWRVMDPLPKWTQEYPYYWEEAWMGCGTAMHVYWYPRPDTQLIEKSFGRSFGTTRLHVDQCRYEPVQSIMETHFPTPDEKAAEARRLEYQYWMDKSHPGLGRDDGRNSQGSPDHVHVFLNQGDAGKRFDVPAFLDPSIGRVRVPIRFISEMMGAEVAWDEASRTVTIHFAAISREVVKAVPIPGYDYTDLFQPEAYLPDGTRFTLENRLVSTPERSIVLAVDQPVALVDGKEVALDAPPIIRHNRTMVPIRFVAEQMGAKVYWVGNKPIFRRDNGTLGGTYQVHVYTPFFPLYEYPSWYMENRAEKF